MQGELCTSVQVCESFKTLLKLQNFHWNKHILSIIEVLSHLHRMIVEIDS